MSEAPVVANPWQVLRALTPARIALGRAGAGLPTGALLEFGLANARARDAVHAPLDADALDADLRMQGVTPLRVHSAARDRGSYLARPDFGRRLDADSARRLDAARTAGATAEIVVAIEDGLSSLAVQRHAQPLLAALRGLVPQRWTDIAVVVALQGRVALGDEIGARLGARLVVVLVGERPGLSSPDSLGIYLTHAPRVGRSDAERNCISNVRPQGLGYADAARRLDWLAGAALARGYSGVALKDDSDAAALTAP